MKSKQVQAPPQLDPKSKRVCVKNSFGFLMAKFLDLFCWHLLWPYVRQMTI